MKLENLEHSRVKATFTVTADEFEKALDQAFTTVVKNVKIDGFRQGKCPRSLFEKKFGVESLYDEALNVVFNNKVGEVYADQEVAQKICGQFTPAIETKDFERGKDFEVSLSFDVLPEVKLAAYKGLEVKKQVLEASEEEITAAINSDLKAHSTLNVKADQTIALHDTAKFDFVGTVDGVEFEGGSATDYELEIGSGQFIPGFEDQMVGMKKDEVKDINVTFPDNYPATELASKAAVFKVIVHEVKESVLPELNDEFVKSLNIKDVNTVDELKAYKKGEIEEGKKTSEHDRQVDDLLNQIINNTEIDMPESIVADIQKEMKDKYESQAKQYNIPFETFLSIMGTTKEAFEENTKASALNQAKFQLVLSEIIKEEKLEPSKEEMEEKAQEIASKSNTTKEAVLKQRASAIYSQITYDKAINLILSSAKEI